MNIGRLRQAHTALACGFGGFMFGIANTWPSYTLEVYVTNTTTPLSGPINKAQEALLGSLPSLGALLGCSIAGSLVNSLGRRIGGVVLSLAALLSWTIISFATSVNVVLAARFLAGISGGSTYVVAPIFISEIAEDSIRGMLASAPVLLYCGGTVTSFIMGCYMSYRPIIWMNVIYSFTTTVLLLLTSESPVFLLKSKREEDAKLSIAKYRGVPISSRVVLDELTKLKQQSVPSIELLSDTDHNAKAEEVEKEKLNLENNESNRPQSTSAIKLLFLQPSSRLAFIVVATLMFNQVFMGITPVQVYAKTVFTQSDPSKADVYTILFAIVMFCGTGITAVITDKAGRRLLLIGSSVLVFISMVLLGYLLQSKTGPPIVTVLMILTYCFFFMLGAGSIPYVLLAEVFVPEVQNLASMILVELVWFFNFVIVIIFPYMNSVFGIYGSFYLFGAVGLVNAVIAYFYVPETKGLSTAQIQEAFLTRKKN